MFEESLLTISLLVAILIVNLITMILVIVSLRKRSSGQENKTAVQVAAAKQTQTPAVTGIIFCRNCGNQYDSTLSGCPNCR